LGPRSARALARPLRPSRSGIRLGAFARGCEKGRWHPRCHPFGGQAQTRAAAALEAAGLLASAEKWQKEIASYATGSGEGFVAMGYVDELMLARAWMLVAAANNAASAATDLCRKVRGNENLEATQKRELEKLKSALK
jgi:hypothetical protein